VEIHPVGVVLVCVDGWMDMTKLIGTFRYYTNTPKKEILISVNSKITAQTEICNFSFQLMK